MIDDMIRLTVDPTYPPRKAGEARESLFDLVLSDNPEAPVNKRRPFSLDVLYPISELKQAVGGSNNKKIETKVRFFIFFFILTNF